MGVEAGTADALPPGGSQDAALRAVTDTFSDNWVSTSLS